MCISSKNIVLCEACQRYFLLRLSLWSSFNMCQLCVITQVLHSCCRCHCFDGAPTCPPALCWLSSKDSGSTPAACFLVFLFNVVTDCGTIQLIVVPIRTGCSWKLLQAFNKKKKQKAKNKKRQKFQSELKHLLLSLSLDERWYFGHLFGSSQLNSEEGLLRRDVSFCGNRTEEV